MSVLLLGKSDIMKTYQVKHKYYLDEYYDILDVNSDPTGATHDTFEFDEVRIVNPNVQFLVVETTCNNFFTYLTSTPLTSDPLTVVTTLQDAHKDEVEFEISDVVHIQLGNSRHSFFIHDAIEDNVKDLLGIDYFPPEH